MPSLPPAIEIAVSARGDGPPVLALHDIGTSGATMAEALKPLTDEYRVITPDLRGHGDSPTPEGPWSVDDFAADAARLVSAEGGSAIVVGAGLGGVAALALTLGHAGLVGGLVLTGVGALAETPAGQERWTRLARGLRERNAPEGIALAAEAMGGRPDWRGALSQLSLPAIVLAGEDDQATPPEKQRELALSLPGARFIAVPDTGHSLPTAAPERLVEAVRALSADPHAVAA